MTVSSPRMRWLAVLTVLAIAVVLGACSDSPAPTPEPTAVPTATPTLEPTATETPTPTPTSAPTATPTLIPTATATPTPTSSPTPPPTPTAEELAAMHLSAIIPWYSNPPADDHSVAADMITRVWLQNASLGDAIATLPWLVDGLSNDEFGSLLALLEFAALPNVQPALLTAAFTDLPSGDLRDHLVLSLRNSAVQNPVIFGEVTKLPWVVDGLTTEEAAFLVSLTAFASEYPGSSAYPEVQSRYFLQSERVSLPLAGEVRVWVFQNVPFQHGEDLAGFIASTARTMEDFLGTPFPTTDVILFVVEDDNTYLATGSNKQHSMWISREALDLPLVAHETAHYYFRGRPSWFSEGASDFLRSFIAYKAGSRELSEWENALIAGPKWTGCISSYEMENLLHLNYRYPTTLLASCSYAMGEHFFLKSMEAIGETALGAAMGELSQWRDSRNVTSEQQIHDTLLQHTPAESLEAFLGVYERLHGGPALPKAPDDHGDEQGTATPLSVGQSVSGALDYRFDLDFFSFQAEQGLEYLVSVRHGALRPSSLGLYATSGRSLARGVEQVESGLQLHWTAPSTGEYYVSVENFAGETGTYTLTVTPE